MAAKKSLSVNGVSFLNLGGLILVLLLVGIPVAITAHWANGFFIVSGVPGLINFFLDLKGITVTSGGHFFISWHDICQSGAASAMGMADQQSSVDQICRNIHIARPAIYATLGLWLVALAVRVLTALLSASFAKQDSIRSNKFVVFSTALTIPLLGAAAIAIIICVITSSIAINTTIYTVNPTLGMRNDVTVIYDAAWFTTMVASTPAVYLLGMELVLLLMALRSNKALASSLGAPLLQVPLSGHHAINNGAKSAPPPYSGSGSGFTASDDKALLLAAENVA